MLIWIPKWEARGWRKADGGIVQNLDLVQQFDYWWGQLSDLDIDYVRAHSGDFGNEMADSLATEGAELYDQY